MSAEKDAFLIPASLVRKGAGSAVVGLYTTSARVKSLLSVNGDGCLKVYDGR
jgi:hypothetical protein